MNKKQQAKKDLVSFWNLGTNIGYTLKEWSNKKTLERKQTRSK